jgi:type I restriction enzyme S subunit
VSAVLTAQEPSAKYLVNLQPPLVRHFDLIAQAPGGLARLRELILTLAVQGKLVPQDPNDEPASELLKKIRAEKDRLIAEGKIKRDKPLDEIADEEKPFEIPFGWTWSRIGSVVNASEAGWSPTCIGSPRSPGKWGVLKVSAVSWGAFDGTANKELPAHLLPRPEYEVMNGDFLLSRANTVDLVARSVVVKKTEPQLMLSDKIIRLNVSGLMNRNFLNLCNNAEYARSHYKSNASGTSSSMKNVSREVVLATLLPLPPLAEQSRIVTRVEELMQLCDALEASGQLEAQQHAQLIATHFDVLLDRPEAVDALEQTILQLAVRGLLVPQDPTDESASVLLQKIRTEKDHLIAQGKIKRDKPLPPITDEEKPFELPQGWAWARWSDVSLKIGDIDHKMPSEVKDGVPYVSPRDFFGVNSIDFDGAKKISHADYQELSSKIRPELGDLIYPRYGTIGVVRKVVEDRKFLASYSCAVIKVMHGFVEPDYQYMFSVSGCAKEQASAATNKTTQPNVGLKSIQEFAMPLPPLAEQSRIVARVNELRSLCADLRQRLSFAQKSQSQLAQVLVEHQSTATATF